jgi:hypothetical protein
MWRDIGSGISGDIPRPQPYYYEIAIRKLQEPSFIERTKFFDITFWSPVLYDYRGPE